MDLLRATADSLDPSPNGPSSKTDGQSPNPPWPTTIDEISESRPNYVGSMIN